MPETDQDTNEVMDALEAAVGAIGEALSMLTTAVAFLKEEATDGLA